jgi:hypothetical protein
LAFCLLAVAALGGRAVAQSGAVDSDLAQRVRERPVTDEMLKNPDAADWLMDAILPRQTVQLGLVRGTAVPLDTKTPELPARVHT